MAKTAIGEALIPAIIDVVGKAVYNAAHDPRTPRAPGVAAAPTTTLVKEKVAQEIAKSPELQHVTNQEPWYKKRSRWASIIGPIFATIVPVAAVYGLDIPIGTEELVVGGLSWAGSVWAAYLAYRAGTATKPLFSE